MGFPAGAVVKNLPANAGYLSSIPGSGRSFGGGNGNPLQYSCLENPMDRGVRQATVYGVTKSRTRLGNWAQTYQVTLLTGGSQRHHGSIYLSLIFLMSSLPMLPTTHITFHLKSLSHKLWIQEVFFGHYPPDPMRCTNWVGCQAGQLLPALANWAADLESFLLSTAHWKSQKGTSCDPVIKNLCRGHGFHPWSGKISPATGLSPYATTTEAHVPWSPCSATKEALKTEAPQLEKAPHAVMKTQGTKNK